MDKQKIDEAMGEFTGSLRSSISIFQKIWIELPADDPQINLMKQILSGSKQACDRLDAQQKQIGKLKSWVEDLDDAWQCASQDCHRLTAENAKLKKSFAGYEKCKKQYEAEIAKLKQDIEHLHGQGGLLFERIAELEKAIQHVPTTEYHDAQEEGCDPNGAWDCFMDSLRKWREQVLHPQKEGETSNPG